MLHIKNSLLLFSLLSMVLVGFCLNNVSLIDLPKSFA
jgi:hypothetical protein